MQELGVTKALRYGTRIGLVQDQFNGQQNLVRLLKALKTHLKQKTVISSNINNITSKMSGLTSANSSFANLLSATTTDINGNKL
ncbi:unnamed protein product, partial [Adineta steineri]